MVGSVEEAQGDRAMLSQLVTALGEDECLFCYVYRMAADPGCDGTLHWAQRWRDLRAPRNKALERHLGDHGGYCDCEIFMNGWTASPTITRTDPETEDEIWPDPMPSCTGVPPRSIQSCSLWLPRRPGAW